MFLDLLLLPPVGTSVLAVGGAACGRVNSRSPFSFLRFLGVREVGFAPGPHFPIFRYGAPTAKAAAKAAVVGEAKSHPRFQSPGGVAMHAEIMEEEERVA